MKSKGGGPDIRLLGDCKEHIFPRYTCFVFFLFCFVFSRLYFSGNFRFTVKLSRQCRDFPLPPAVTHTWPLPLPTSPTWVVHLFQLINVHSHISITQSPSLTLEFILGVIHLVDVDSCTMTHLHHYSIIQSNCTALKILWVPPFRLLLPRGHWQLLIFLLCQSFASSRISHGWNHTGGSLVSLVILISNMHLSFFFFFLSGRWLIAFCFSIIVHCLDHFIFVV